MQRDSNLPEENIEKTIPKDLSERILTVLIDVEEKPLVADRSLNGDGFALVAGREPLSSFCQRRMAVGQRDPPLVFVRIVRVFRFARQESFLQSKDFTT